MSDRLSSLSGSGIKQLNLSGCRLGDCFEGALHSLVELPFLESLNLSSSTVCNNDLSVLSRLKSLRSLNLAGCVKLSEHGFEFLRDIELRELDLSKTAADQQTLIWIGHMPLESLSLSSCRVEDNDLKLLLPFSSSLTHLDCSYCCLTTKGLQPLTRMECLKRLELASIRIGNAGLALFKQMNLTSLDVSTAGIDDDGLIYLCNMPLTYLNLSFCPVTDIGFAQLLRSNLPLQELNLSSTQVTFAGLRALLGDRVSSPQKKRQKPNSTPPLSASNPSSKREIFPHLRCLSLYHCYEVSSWEVEMLRKERGNLVICR